MTLLTVLRARLAAVVGAVSGVGRVHDYFRRSQHEAENQTLFVQTGKLHTWLLSLAEDTPYTERRKVGGCSEATVRFTLHGYFSLKDADESEKQFEAALQDVLAGLRADPTLGGDPVIEAQPPAVALFGHAQFASVLCHYARVEMAIRAHLEG